MNKYESIIKSLGINSIQKLRDAAPSPEEKVLLNTLIAAFTRDELHGRVSEFALDLVESGEWPKGLEGEGHLEASVELLVENACAIYALLAPVIQRSRTRSIAPAKTEPIICPIVAAQEKKTEVIIPPVHHSSRPLREFRQGGNVGDAVEAKLEGIEPTAEQPTIDWTKVDWQVLVKNTTKALETKHGASGVRIMANKLGIKGTGASVYCWRQGKNTPQLKFRKKILAIASEVGVAITSK